MVRRSHRARAVALSGLVVSLALALPSQASAIQRTAVIARAKVWVAANVPYSQSRYATVAGAVLPTSTVSPSQKGYRTDCSGFVSMSLSLKTSKGYPLSLDTASLPAVLYRISKDDLQPGDVILRPKTLVIDGKQVPYGHALIFGGWANSAHTSYYGYHESGSADKAAKATITYPFWGEPGFSPYRYRYIEPRYKRMSGIAVTGEIRPASITTLAALETLSQTSQ